MNNTQVNRFGVFVVLTALGTGCAAHGALDKSFGTDGIVTTVVGSQEAGVHGIAIQGDGKIVVAGYVTISAGDNDFALVRYSEDGSLDPSFGGSGIVTTAIGTDTNIATSVAIQQNGKIVAAGTIGAPHAFGIVRYNTDGSVDPFFGSGGSVTTSLSSGHDEASAIAVQSDGRIVVAGKAGGDFGLTRYMSNGTLDPTFDGDGIVTTPVGQNAGAWGIAIQPDGRIVAAGGSADVVVVRYLADGSLDPTFDADGIVTTPVSALNEAALAILLQPDKRIVVGGYRAEGGGDDFALVRYDSDGSLDASFGSGGIVTTHVTDDDNSIYGLALQTDGRLLAAGVGHSSGTSKSDIVVTRYNIDGSLDTSYGNNGTVITHVDRESYALAAALEASGKLVVAGQLERPAGTAEFIVVRYLGGGCGLPCP